jgi:hypothetical protein
MASSWWRVWRLWRSAGSPGCPGSATTRSVHARHQPTNPFPVFGVAREFGFQPALLAPRLRVEKEKQEDSGFIDFLPGRSRWRADWEECDRPKRRSRRMVGARKAPTEAERPTTQEASHRRKTFRCRTARTVRTMSPRDHGTPEGASFANPCSEPAWDVVIRTWAVALDAPAWLAGAATTLDPPWVSPRVLRCRRISCWRPAQQPDL